MRILITGILSPWAPSFGGGQVLTHELAVQLQSAGHVVQAIYTRPAMQSPVAPPYPVDWLPHSSRMLMNVLPMARAVGKSFDRFDFDVIHSSGVEGLAIRPPSGVPLVHSEYYASIPSDLAPDPWHSPIENLLHLYRRRYFLATRRLAQRADRVILLSRFSADQVATSYRIGLEKTAIIPFGIDAGKVTPRSEGKPSRGSILFLGRVDPSKGLDYLLQAMRKVHAIVPASLLTVIGGGLIQNYQDLARRLGVDDFVTFSGHMSHEDVLHRLHEGDVFVLPSLMESFGGVLLEAMAARLPVVSTRVGAIPEVVEDNLTGLLVPPGDAEALAKALVRVLTDQALADRLSSNAYKVAAHSGVFSWERFAERHLDVYRSARLEKNV